MFAVITRQEQYQSPKKFEEVYKTLQDRVDQCLHKTVTQTVMVGGQMEVLRTTFNPSVNKVGPDLAEVVIQVPVARTAGLKLHPVVCIRC